MKYLQITCCILSCLCVGATVLVGVLAGWLYALIPVVAAVLFALLMIGAKRGFKRTPTPPRTDFMNSDEENRKILDEKKDDE